MRPEVLNFAAAAVAVNAVEVSNGTIVSLLDFREGRQPQDLVIHTDLVDGVYYITYFDEEEITGIECEARTRSEAIATIYRIITGLELPEGVIPCE
jgi:hypothetical protein